LSLSALGRCISALVKKGKGSSKSLAIPFRDSVLTWLLRESLAGNARTRMMATISPASINAKETLSTLRYAHSAKMITTKATVIQDPKEQRINFLASEVLLYILK
jgi:kinesin family member 1